MKTVCIVQARMGSKRLPGKVLLPLNGHTVIAEVLTRCQRIPGVDHVVCAVPANMANQTLALYLGVHGFNVYQGAGGLDENDVLQRYLAAASEYEADVIVRVTGDCPLISPDLCGEVIRAREAAKADYASNIHPRTFPRGLDCEVFTQSALCSAHIYSRPEQREHVTPWMREQASLLKWANVVSPWPMDGRLCLDTEDDYKVICAAFGHEPYQRLRAA